MPTYLYCICDFGAGDYYFLMGEKLELVKVSETDDSSYIKSSYGCHAWVDNRYLVSEEHWNKLKQFFKEELEYDEQQSQ